MFIRTYVHEIMYPIIDFDISGFAHILQPVRTRCFWFLKQIHIGSWQKPEISMHFHINVFLHYDK